MQTEPITLPDNWENISVRPYVQTDSAGQEHLVIVLPVADIADLTKAKPQLLSDYEWIKQEQEYYAVLDCLMQGMPTETIMQQTGCTKNLVGLLQKIIKESLKRADFKMVDGKKNFNEWVYVFNKIDDRDSLDKKDVPTIAARCLRYRSEGDFKSSTGEAYLYGLAAAMIHLRNWGLAKSLKTGRHITDLLDKFQPAEVRNVLRRIIAKIGHADFDKAMIERTAAEVSTRVNSQYMQRAEVAEMLREEIEARQKENS